MNNIVRLLRRLSVLRPAEIMHRLLELAHMRRLHARIRSGDLDRCYAELKANDYLFCRSKDAQLPALVFSDPPNAQVISDLLAGKSPALGFDWQWKRASGCWNLAPDTGRSWPADVFFDSINYRAGNPYGDVRVAWEPARLQQLLGLALVAEKDAKCRDQAVERLVQILESWVSENPPARGIHYLSVMECALRILSVTHALDKVRPYLEVQSPAWQAVTVLVKSHADLILGRLSLYSSTGNHTTAECAGLVYAGLLFPEMDGAWRWLDKGMEILEREASHQILSDGGGIERSPWYHVQVVDLFGLVEYLLGFHDRPVPEAIVSAVRRGREYIAKLAVRPDGLPRLNDADDGFVLSPWLRISWANRRLSGPLETFPDTGMTRILLDRSGDSWLIFDHGPMGMPPLYAHAHADALSVCIELGGQPLATDPGTYMYTGGLEWRQYFRGTSAHNTVQIDALDQALQATPFQWAKPCEARLVKSVCNEDGTVYLLARHNGYQALKIKHWRGVIFVPDEKIIIYDFIDGKGKHRIDMHWHMETIPVEVSGGLRFEGYDRPVVMKVTGGERTVHRGESSPVLGWKSGIYGEKHPLTTVCVCHSARLPHEMLTVFHFSDQADMGAVDHRYVDTLRSWL